MTAGRAGLAEARALRRRGELAGAQRLCRDILARHPDHHEALHLLAELHMQAGSHQEALTLVRQAIALAPAEAAYHFTLGALLRLRGHPGEAARAYERAIALRPDFVEALYNLGVILQHLNRPDEALDAFRRALQLRPDLAAALLNMGNILHGQGLLEEAAEAYRAILRTQPGHVDALNNLGNTLKDLGRLEEARACLEEALRRRPCAKLFYDLSLIRPCRDRNDPLRRRMEALLARPGLASEDRIQLHFALARACEQTGDHEEAFRHLVAGNRCKRATFEFDIQDEARRFRRLAEIFDADFFAEAGADSGLEAAPVFIVGMPRSGTSLVEQILAVHPGIHAAGELGDLTQALAGAGLRQPEAARGLGREQWRRIGLDYLRRLERFQAGDRRITNKLPANFRHIGLIRRIFPRARIIHCRRDPRDTCLSCYKQLFTGPLPYCYDLTELGRYYGLYRGLMAHWHRVLPGFVLDVDYERLVTEPRTVVGAILSHCGLPWHEDCLHFHRHRRAVKTASALQVRRPLYTSAIGAWRRYASWLGPLLEALEGCD